MHVHLVANGHFFLAAIAFVRSSPVVLLALFVTIPNLATSSAQVFADLGHHLMARPPSTDPLCHLHTHVHSDTIRLLHKNFVHLRIVLVRRPGLDNMATAIFKGRATGLHTVVITLHHPRCFNLHTFASGQIGIRTHGNGKCNMTIFVG